MSGVKLCPDCREAYEGTHDCALRHEPPVLLAAEFDNLFKEIITAGWCVKSDGHVESPQGYFAVVEIPSHPGELKEMQDAVEEGMRPFTDWPKAGWYFTTENSDGLIHVYKMSHDRSWETFAKTLDQYVKWDND